MWPSQSASGRRKAQSNAPEQQQVFWPSESSAQYDNNCLAGQMNKSKQDRPQFDLGQHGQSYERQFAYEESNRIDYGLFQGGQG